MTYHSYSHQRRTIWPTVGIAVACFLSFTAGIWVMDKTSRHRAFEAPNWRNACQLTDVNGNPAFKLAPAEKLATN